jgi:hypothetical protein
MVRHPAPFLQFNAKALKCPSATAHVAVRLREKASSTTRYGADVRTLTPIKIAANTKLLTRTQMAGRCKCGSTED